MRAMSSGCPIRPSGVPAIIAFSKSLPTMPALCVPSVSTPPGAIALTRILRGPSAAAKYFTSVSIAPCWSIEAVARTAYHHGASAARRCSATGG